MAVFNSFSSFFLGFFRKIRNDQGIDKSHIYRTGTSMYTENKHIFKNLFTHILSERKEYHFSKKF